MRPHLLGVDHVVILVNDLDHAQAAWSRLGFTLTPRGFHSIGTRNHCLMFGSDYLELLALGAPHPVTAAFAAFLEGGEGAAAIAFATDDAQACWTDLRAAGIAADPPVDFSRPVQLDGHSRDARFRVTQLPPAATPGSRSFLCQHFTRELVWLPAYQQHPLGATGIAGLTLRVDEVDTAAARYGEVTGVAPQRAGRSARVSLDRFCIEFVPADAAASTGRPAPAIERLELYVRDLDQARAQLAQAGVAVEPGNDRSLMLSAPVHGVSLSLRADPGPR